MQNTYKQKEQKSGSELKNLTGESTKISFDYITLTPEQVKISVIHSPHNPREVGSLLESELNELAGDIKEKGQLEAIWLYMNNGMYEILDGARRCRVLSVELKQDIKAKVIRGSFTDVQLSSIAFSLSSGVGLSLIEKGRVWDTEMKTRKYGSMRKFCEIKKLSLSQVSDAIAAYNLPENLKSVFPKITTVGKPTLKKLGEFYKAIRQANNESNYEAVTVFNFRIINDIDQDVIDYDLYTEAKIKAEKKDARKLKAARNDVKKREHYTDEDINNVTIEKTLVEVSNNRVNSAIINAMIEIFESSGFTNENVIKESIESLRPTLTKHSTKTGIKIELQNLTAQQQDFAIEINQAFIDTVEVNVHETLSLNDVNKDNFARLNETSQDTIILLFNSLVKNQLDIKARLEVDRVAIPECT